MRLAGTVVDHHCMLTSIHVPSAYCYCTLAPRTFVLGRCNSLPTKHSSLRQAIFCHEKHLPSVGPAASFVSYPVPTYIHPGRDVAAATGTFCRRQSR